jgi:hypothetical protein
MMFWMGALGFSIGGFRISGLNFRCFYLFLQGFTGLFNWEKVYTTKRVGYLTLIFLAFSVIYLLYSMDIHADTPLQAFVTTGFVATL